MNTEVRRNIFCVVMTSEDYLDAFEKLLRFVITYLYRQKEKIRHAYFKPFVYVKVAPL